MNLSKEKTLILSKSDIQEKLTKFILEYFVKDTGLIVNDRTSFLDEGILDSTGVMELVVFIESAFEVHLEDDEIVPDNFDSINKLVNFIHMKSENKQQMCPKNVA